MLNHFEKRRLRAIEQSLETEDPELAERLKSASAEQPPGVTQSSMSGLTFFGTVFALVALPVSPVLATVILAAPMVITAWIKVMAAGTGSATDERPTAESDEN